ncbi:trigger factor [Candidatus Poriferisodalis sp.]|uniref:trigger factor n=1 Tax=Candidatus Poriferisodalis sp. TaxID=3101277 RepID=UPI003B024B6D
MKTTLTPLDPADFIGPAPVSEPAAPPADGTAAASDALDGPSDDRESDRVENGAADRTAAQERFVGPRVKLAVEVDAETFDADVDVAFRKLAREVRIPGFRPGRAPRRVMESHFGPEYGRAQALEDAVPRYYAEAVRDHGLDVINQPELDLTLDGSEGPVAFDAIVEVRPLVSISGYEHLRIELPSPVPTEDEIDARIDQTRRQFADITEVDRPAAPGDRVTIDIEGAVEGTPLPGLSAQAYLYELGSGGIVPEVDEQLTGCEAGAELSFSAPHPAQPDKEIDFEVAVSTVSELVLPELTDDWADEHTEHDSVAELREATARELSVGHIMRANMALRDEAQRQLAELVEGPVPDAMVSGAIAERMSELSNGLQQRNMTVEQWLEATGQAPASFISELRDEAERGVRLDLALRAVAAAEDVQADDEDISAELDRMAAADGRSAEHLREALAAADGLAHLTSAIRKTKALRWAIAAATLVGPDGDALERSALELPATQDAQSDDARSDDIGDTP